MPKFGCEISFLIAAPKNLDRVALLLLHDVDCCTTASSSAGIWSAPVTFWTTKAGTVHHRGLRPSGG